MNPLIWIHVAAGGVALIAGAGALIAAKGGRAHRRAGTLFVVAMVTMAGLAASLAFAYGQKLNTIAGVFTLYLVATSWATVKRPTDRRFQKAGLVVALSVAAAGVALGSLAAASATGLADGDPSSGQAAGIYFFFGALGVLAAALDVNVLARRTLSRSQRLARHLWRMCAALAIAAGSFFIGQADELPAVIQGSPLLPLPMLATLAFMTFWLLRLRFGRFRTAAAPAH